MNLSANDRKILATVQDGPAEMAPSSTKHGRRNDIRRLADRGLVTYTVETLWKKTGPAVLAYHVTITAAGLAALE